VKAKKASGQSQRRKELIDTGGWTAPKTQPQGRRALWGVLEAVLAAVSVRLPFFPSLIRVPEAPSPLSPLSLVPGKQLAKFPGFFFSFLLQLFISTRCLRALAGSYH
jgi:hypothetical protein